MSSSGRRRSSGSRSRKSSRQAATPGGEGASSGLEFDHQSLYETEVLPLMQQLIANHCVNPGDGTGTEGKNARTVADYFDSKGLGDTYQLIGKVEGRENIIAVAGSGSPTLMLGPGHMDVVPVDLSHWDTPPDQLTEKDGMLYGRGAIDMLYIVAAQAVVFAHLAQNAKQLIHGTLKYVGCVDEENGSGYGVAWLVENHPDLIKADFALGEAGGFPTSPGSDAIMFTTGEKGGAHVRFTAKGDAGHASLPYRRRNASALVAKAVARIADYETPVVVQDTFKEMIYGSPGRSALWKFRLTTPMLVDSMIDSLGPEESSAVYHALTRMTLSPTVVHGGQAGNVFPSTAYGIIDCRLLPGQDKDYVTKHLKKALGSLYDELDWSYEVYFPGSDSGVHHKLWPAIQSALTEVMPGKTAIPWVVMGGSDLRFMRNAVGAIAIGAALAEPNSSMNEMMSQYHSNNECVSVKTVINSTGFFYRCAVHFFQQFSSSST